MAACMTVCMSTADDTTEDQPGPSTATAPVLGITLCVCMTVCVTPADDTTEGQPGPSTGPTPPNPPHTTLAPVPGSIAVDYWTAQSGATQGTLAQFFSRGPNAGAKQHTPTAQPHTQKQHATSPVQGAQGGPVHASGQARQEGSTQGINPRRVNPAGPSQPKPTPTPTPTHTSPPAAKDPHEGVVGGVTHIDLTLSSPDADVSEHSPKRVKRSSEDVSELDAVQMMRQSGSVRPNDTTPSGHIGHQTEGTGSGSQQHGPVPQQQNQQQQSTITGAPGSPGPSAAAPRNAFSMLLAGSRAAGQQPAQGGRGRGAHDGDGGRGRGGAGGGRFAQWQQQRLHQLAMDPSK